MSEIVRGGGGRRQTSTSPPEPDEATDEMDALDEASLERKAPGGAGWAGRVGLVPLLSAVIALLVLMLVGLTVAYLVKPGSSAASRQAANASGIIPEQLPGQVVKRATFGDWSYVCVKPDNGDARCSISQELTDARSNAPIFRWRISTGPDGALVGEWDTPSGVNVGQGIVLDAGWDKPARIPFQACFPEGCQAVAGFDPDAADRLSKTGKAVVTMFPVDAGSSGVQLAFSVKGLPEALAALK